MAGYINLTEVLTIIFTPVLQAMELIGQVGLSQEAQHKAHLLWRL
jgi:hypothetical protein